MPAFWRGCIEGRCRRASDRRVRATAFPCRIAGEAWGFDPLTRMSPKEARGAARFVQFAVCAAAEAWDDAGLGNAEIGGSRLSVVWGTGSGGAPMMDEVLGAAREGGWAACEPLALLKVTPDSAANALAMRFGAHGPVSTVVAACASSTLAVLEAARLIREGRATSRSPAAARRGSRRWASAASACCGHSRPPATTRRRPRAGRSIARAMASCRRKARAR